MPAVLGFFADQGDLRDYVSGSVDGAATWRPVIALEGLCEGAVHVAEIAGRRIAIYHVDGPFDMTSNLPGPGFALAPGGLIEARARGGLTGSDRNDTRMLFGAVGRRCGRGPHLENLPAQSGRIEYDRSGQNGRER
ncbi:putative ferredoxin component CadC of Rieske non-heme iron oxygenase CadABCD complex [Sphingobium herbicidovorans NBRC 16415]|uniref:Ferredoxin component CadC of Rieske non-heme iron oxygenase CadABCD complex n=1 Tax=Sphingobium herbicidovorans (strain ATCC 700291 / DSM 11019 / CCUG 56400 / KCTC 2939 / LMG 18315 / NBRC 16415 / MH) TaxID=1219045 RepID=A0A086P7W5_SPHHM|nr:putative ferredoxin component CadC of Rieske non-heme iron oxygenase CadABCD complex [Sphingobium herbicidovorans NBRC 16415]